MERTVTVCFDGKPYEVPSGLTIMSAMEYAGYQLKRGCGCRNGFCGACATVWRIGDDPRLHTGLACRAKVEEGMCVATPPGFPLAKQTHDIQAIRPDGQIIRQLYPEIDACVGCNACTRVCPQRLDVRQYVDYARHGEYEKCAAASFECVMCGLCVSRCPVGIDQPQIAMLARRLNGRYLTPACAHLDDRVKEIGEGRWAEELAALMGRSVEELKELYDHRDIEP